MRIGLLTGFRILMRSELTTPHTAKETRREPFGPHIYGVLFTLECTLCDLC
jgi:hypothetical protein